MSDGPLSKLLRGLGLDDKLPAIPTIERIEERPVSLNPEVMFKMAPCPDLMSDTGIHALELWKDGPVLPTNIPESKLRAYDLDLDYASFRPEGERWRCIDLNTFDGGPDKPGCFEGYGASMKEAKLALLDLFAEYDERQKPSRVIHSSPFEPPTYADREPRDRLTEDDE